MKYLCTSVVGLGRSGVWRIRNLEYSKDGASNYDMGGSTVFQPEQNGFYLFQLQAGS